MYSWSASETFCSVCWIFLYGKSQFNRSQTMEYSLFCYVQVQKWKKKITWKGAYTFKRSFLSSSIDVDISIDLRTNYNTPWKCSNIINQTCSSIFLFWGFFFSKLKSMVEIFEFTLSNSIFGISVLNWIIVQTSKRMRKFDKKNSYFNYSQCRHCKSLCI